MICVRTVRALIISISCVRLGGCVILEEHPSSPPIFECRTWSLDSNEHLGK